MPNRRLQLGQVVLVRLIFADQTGSKLRPAVVLRQGGDGDLLVAPVTSHGARTTFDVVLLDWQAGGLRLPSVARIDKLATLAPNVLVSQLGVISPRDRSAVVALCRKLVAEIADEEV